MKPYGDTLNDGMVQLAFVLPISYSEKAKKAAEMYVSKLNFRNISYLLESTIRRIPDRL